VEQQSRDCYTTLQKFVAAFTDENKNIVNRLDEKRAEDKKAQAKMTSKLNEWVSEVEK
jgi:hypothetical protein